MHVSFGCITDFEKTLHLLSSSLALVRLDVGLALHALFSYVFLILSRTAKVVLLLRRRFLLSACRRDEGACR